MQKRIDYIDGLKGISGIAVSLYHFMILGNFAGFVGFGTNYTAEEAVERVLKYPLSSFAVGNSVGLYVFLILIAVFPVISYRKKYFDSKLMGRYACKRYFQLMPMCLIVSLIMVLMFNAGLMHFEDITTLTGNPWVATCNPDHTDILLAIKALLFDNWLSNSREITSLWCLHIVLKGSLLVYAVYALFGQSKFKYLPVLALFILSLTDVNIFVFACGSLLGELLAKEETKPWPLIVCLLVIVICICFMKVPVPLYPIKTTKAIPCSIGSFLIVLSVSKCEKLRNLFSNKILTFLGKISFEVVICHVFILGTVAYPITIWLMTKLDFGLLFGSIIGIICTILTIPVAYLVAKWITPLGGKLAKKVETMCFEKD